MRKDAVGFFWADLPPVKAVKAVKPKRVPPNRTWERPDYLPGLEEARAFNVPLYTQDELIQAWLSQEPLVYDIECYINYFLIAFVGIRTKKIVYFEMYYNCPLNIEALTWVMTNFCTIGFNSKGYDLPIASLAMAGCTNAQLKEATNLIIEERARPSDVLQHYKVRLFKCNHIDIMEVAPSVRTGLKTYMARLHAKRLQDLPFPPATTLSYEQMLIIRFYCVNDLHGTDMLYEGILEAIHLRERMGQQYGMDLRSRSDAQVAEDIISHELYSLTGRRAQRNHIAPGTLYSYNPPAFLRYQTELLNSVIGLVASCNFRVDEDGYIEQPPAMDKFEFMVGDSKYRMGIGGLHSCEERQSHVADEETVIKVIDVTSFYPIAILNQSLYPTHLGIEFLSIYRRIVEQRIDAKRRGDNATADSLKITINGSYGKFGSKWSILYAPHLIIQVTLTGQLALLMLIEAFELSGIKVISANTDGIVVKYNKQQEDLVNNITQWWEGVTDFNMESEFYKALYCANVNNYIGIKANGKLTRKGWFAETGLRKNCTGDIIMDAVIGALTNGTPVRDTIAPCTDITKFVVIRSVGKGGACWDGEFLGKVVRWYYSVNEQPEIVSIHNGNKVAGSTNGVPVMQLPDVFPQDVDYEEYIKRAEKFLEKLGYA